MLCFIDESGDPGLKLGEGSSNLFTIVIVLFEEKDEANRCDSSISQLRKDLTLKANSEFHFVHCTHNKRIKFFECVTNFEFKYWTITINKSKLYGEGFKYKSSFYKYACSLVLNNAKQYLENAIVTIDGGGSREFRKELQSYIRKQVNDKDKNLVKIKQVKVQASHKNNLIQLSDMICGAVAYSLKLKKKNRREYRDLIRKREIFCQIWPKKK